MRREQPPILHLPVPKSLAEFVLAGLEEQEYEQTDNNRHARKILRAQRCEAGTRKPAEPEMTGRPRPILRGPAQQRDDNQEFVGLVAVPAQ
jgi:hypothetical protein